MTVMLVGLGALGSRVLDGLLRAGAEHSVVVAGRDEQRTRTRFNLARFSAMQLTDRVPPSATAHVDLCDVDRTAETIAAVRPDVIVNCATTMPYGLIARLPAGTRERLDAVGLGPWLATHLAPADSLMRAVHLAGVDSAVVNCAYPDAVDPALAGAGRAPLVGTGNVGNNEPAIRCALADRFGVPVEDVTVWMVMHHAVSHRIHRLGTAGGAPFHLSATVGGSAVDVDSGSLFAELATRYRRGNGVDGRLMAAASTVAVTIALLADSPRRLHVPGPSGLVGGYPAEVGLRQVRVTPPPGLTEAAAVQLNVAAQRYDGIESIGPDGTVTFTAEAAEVFRTQLGHDCRSLRVDEASHLADELSARCKERVSG
ncbi:MAG TPA: NAD-dependent epimerase/dehydratase family protein [Micromonosporaceae bacterium]|nr:NAD-dependent epimerase/dehydratase family protein [Micromonosporaceae bacterium]